MFDRKSNYALNKRDKNSIIYPSATGPIRLTRADFSSEDEFLTWKRWSDEDYHTTEKAGRAFYDKGIPLDDNLDAIGAVPSVEDTLFLALEEAEAEACHVKRCAELMEQIRRCLTEIQFRRLWMSRAKGMRVKEIAVLEKARPQGISKSLASAIQKIKKKCNQPEHGL